MRAAVRAVHKHDRRQQTTARQLSDELIRRLGASLRGIQLYTPTHPIVSSNLEGLTRRFVRSTQHEARS